MPKRKLYSKSLYADEEPYNQETYQLWVDAFKPTELDLRRELTEEQLKELCRRKRCRVEMNWNNPVHAYKIKFMSQGRLQHSEKRNNKLLAKAGMRFMQEHPKFEQECAEERAEIWKQRKKYNLLALDLWAFEREKEKQRAATANAVDATEPESQSHAVTNNTEIDIEGESQPAHIPEVASEQTAPTTSQSEGTSDSVVIFIPNKNTSTAVNLASSEEGFLTQEFAYKSNNNEKAASSVNSSNSVFNNFNDIVNSESILLPTQSTQDNVQPLSQASQGILPCTGTDEFEKQITCTSTQNQQESEVIDIEN